MKNLLFITLLYFSPLLWTCLCKQGGVGGEVSAQQQLIDSLQLQLKNHNAHKLELGNNAPMLFDTTKANLLYELSKSYRDNDPPKAIDFANQSLKLSQQVGFKKGIGNAYNSLGLSYKNKGDFFLSIEYFKKSLAIRTEIADKVGMAFCYNNIGGVYFSIGSFPLALQNHLVALKIREEINDKNSIASSYNNIGMIYMMQGAYQEALNYFNTALRINKENGNKVWESANLENIGLTKIYQQKYSEALIPFFESLKILKQTDDLYSLAGTYLNIGDAYAGLENYSQALSNYFASLKINIEMDDKEGQAISNMSIGTIYAKKKEFKQASEFISKGLLLSKEIGSLEVMKKCYEAMSSMDIAQGSYKQALTHYKQFIEIRDSMFNQENTNKTVALQLQYDTEKKEKQIALLTKESQLQQTELQKQSTTRNVLIAGCALIALLAGIIYNRYRIKQKANAAIESTMQNLKATQEQLVEHEKLAALGKFTAEVAKEVEQPVKQINELTKINRTLLQNIKKNNSDEDATALKNNLKQIFKYGREADAVVKKVLNETRKFQA